MPRAPLPLQGEWQVHKPGKGAFWATGLHEKLQARGITHLLFAGVTTEVCVQTSMREANDRGYECLLVTDATGKPSAACRPHSCCSAAVLAPGAVHAYVRM